MEMIVHTEAGLKDAAKELLGNYPGARIFAFYGAMGAGKTTFIKAICSELRVCDLVQSPTFSIVNEYRTASGESLFHFDFYRLKSVAEAYDIGYEDYFYSGAWCFIEWPEKIEELLPDQVVRVTIAGSDVRSITY